jgi:hypothetical protein
MAEAILPKMLMIYFLLLTPVTVGSAPTSSRCAQRSGLSDGEFDLALLDVKNRVRDLSLRKNNLILPIFRYRFSLAHLGEKFFGIERGLTSLPQTKPPFFPSRRQCEAERL